MTKIALESYRRVQRNEDREIVQQGQFHLQAKFMERFNGKSEAIAEPNDSRHHGLEEKWVRRKALGHQAGACCLYRQAIWPVNGEHEQQP